MPIASGIVCCLLTRETGIVHHLFLHVPSAMSHAESPDALASNAAPPVPVQSFEDLPLAPEVLAAVKKIGYEQPSPVQAESIPVLASGSDLLATAQTGTGKTAAFALPLLSRIDAKNVAPQALILAPTRELAIQVGEALKSYASEMKGISVLSVYGGQGMGNQLSQLKRGVHIIVGTPGRVMDHLRRKSLKLGALKTLVLDEADEMLRMGFIDDVEWILEHTPKNRQTALFSATMPKPIKKIADTYLSDPTEVSIKNKTKTVELIEQSFWAVSGASKFDGLCRILDVEEPDGVVIFVRTKSSTTMLAEKLQAAGYAAAPINGDMTQQLRERTIAQIKNGRIDILIATDVAARGIDVPRISLVVNYDMPYDNETYVHRIGRTGRAGREGKAIMFVAPREKRLLHSIERSTKQKIKSITLPSKREVAQKRAETFKNKVKTQLTASSDPIYTQIVNELIEETQAPAEQIAVALASLDPKDQLNILDSGKLDSTHDQKSRDGKSKNNTGDKPRKRDGRVQKKHSSKQVLDEDGKPVKMDNYRVEVGHDHNVSPSDIVGCIANEAGISSQYIGRIQLFDDYSYVELPEGMPKEVAQHLKNVRVKQTKFDLKLVGKLDDQAADSKDTIGDGERRQPRKRKAKKPIAKKAKSKKGVNKTDKGSPDTNKNGKKKARKPARKKAAQ